MNLPNMKVFLALCRSALVLALLTLSSAPDVRASGMPAPVAHSPASTPLATLLNSDGTLNLSTGFNGSLDISGWSMALAADGTPHFSRADNSARSANNAPAPKPASLSDDTYWDGRFDYPPGAVGLAVNTLAVDGTDLYVGGFFTTTGSLSVNNVARWNPENGWSALGNGVDGIIFALAVSGSTVYAGGSFTQVCGNSACNIGNTTANHVAVWNGSASAWSALGNGVSGSVDALAVSGSTVYAGGVFFQACGNSACNSGNTSVNRIAAWNGSSWSALGNGVSGIVHALAVSGSTVYVGGDFAQACGNSACNSGNTEVNYIAAWNGSASAWSPLGNGLSNGVDALAVSGSTVYAGGLFFFVCGDSACSSGNTRINFIAAWNGSSWSALGNGMNNDVVALAVSGGTLVAGGQFTQLCGNATCDSGNTTVNRTAVWNGSTWSALGNGLSSAVAALAVSGSTVYAGGDFTQVCGNLACNSGNTTVNNIAMWNGSASAWSALGSGANDVVLALAVSGGNVYAGGAFNSIGGVTAHGVAVWNGNSWSAVGNGVGGPVNALAVSGVDVFAGGQFIVVCGNPTCTSGNTTVNRVAMWNGSSWSALSNGVDFVVNALAVSGSTIYAGGQFTQVCTNAACVSGGTTVNHVAAWNGSNWSSLGNGVSNSVNALVVSGSTVYVGGEFTQVCGNAACNGGNSSANRVAAWNGSNWLALGNGVSDSVNALAVNGSTVYAGGLFSQVCGLSACNSGNTTVNHIAAWNGSSWSALGNGIVGVANALVASGNTVYVGGFFTQVCGNLACNSGNVSANNVAMWNGSSWSALGSGMNSSVFALGAIGPDLYAGGTFTTAGGKPSFNFAHWNKSFFVYLPLLEK